jgi:small-conductance mechanosensitive channel
MMNVKQNLLLAFVQDVQYFGVTNWLIWGQLVIVSISLAIGYAIGRYAERRVEEKSYHTQQKIVRAQRLARLFFPISSFVIISLVNAILHMKYHHPFYLLELVGALLLAMVVLRVLIRMLQITFSTKQWVRQSERWILWSVWIVFALYVTGFSEPIIAALQSINFRYGKTVISMWDILQTLVVVACTLLISLVLSHIIEVRLLQTTTGDMSLRVVVARLVKAFFVVLAFMIALPLVGIDLTVLSVFGGALGVGLGFGLQKIASNYVSGFILLLDRSLRIGDMVQIGDEQGQVQGLTARYMVLKALNGTVALIPNDTLISSVVINKSYIDQNSVVVIRVRVAYDSDIKLALQLMLDATQGLERILVTPAPGANFKRFAENGIDLELGFWIADQEIGTGSLESTINMRIWESFRKNNICFVFRSWDINLVSVPESVEALLPPKERIEKK